MNMEKSGASGMLRSALKRRTRRWRRRQVVGFYALMLVCLATTLGNNHHAFWGFWWAVFGVLIAISDVFSRWPRNRRLVVTSLDDRAQVEYGLDFERLSAAQQDGLLRKYRMGAFPVDETPDERDKASRLHADEKAFRLLRIFLPCFSAAYWMVYLWVPAGPLRDALMDSPVLISWLMVFVISLPRIIEMWTEPDRD